MLSRSYEATLRSLRLAASSSPKVSSGTNIAFPRWRPILNTRGTASRPPVYFSGPNARQVPNSSVHQMPPPIYFGNDGQPPVLDIHQPKVKKGRPWSLWIASAMMGTGVIGFFLLYKESVKNYEEVPYVHRKRYPLYAVSRAILPSNPDEKLKGMGLPTWERVLKAGIFARREDGDEVVEATYQMFERLITANGLGDRELELRILEDSGRRHLEQSLSRQIMVDRMTLQSFETPEQVASHLSSLISAAVLNHREELFCDLALTVLSNFCASLFVPITLLSKRARWVTLPVMAVCITDVFALDKRSRSQEYEADLVSIQFLDKAGINVMGFFHYWGFESALMSQELQERAKSSPMSPKATREIKVSLSQFTEMTRHFRNASDILQEHYPDKFPKQKEIDDSS